MLASAVVGALVWVCVEHARARGTETAVLWPADDIKWSDSPAVAGAKTAVLWGDPKTGGYGALRRIPAGSGLPAHTHTHDQRVVVVTGTIALSVGDGPARKLGSGSYAFVPGGAVHSVDCLAGADCISFEEQDGASDVTFVNPSAPRR